MLNAIYSASEIALLSVNIERAEKKAEAGGKSARRVLALKKTPENFLATVQVGITLAGFLASAFAASNFSAELAEWIFKFDLGLSLGILNTVSLIVITIVLSFFTIIFGELVPKRLAMKKAEQLAYLCSGFIWVSLICFKPIICVLSGATNLILRFAGIDPREKGSDMSEEDIRLMVDAGGREGVIEKSEQELINNVFEFDDKTAAELMTHRLETVILYLKDSDKDWEKTIIEKRHSFYPVCGGTVDDIRGVLSTREYLLMNTHARDAVLKRAVFTPQFIPESQKADVIFNKMKASSNHFALVIDEYGGFSGILTINDLLSAIVGEF